MASGKEFEIAAAKAQFAELAQRYGSEENAAAVSGIMYTMITAAFEGQNDGALTRLQEFFATRKKAFEMYTPVQTEALEAFDELIVKSGNIKKAAEKVGLLPSVISPLRKGTYAGKTNAVFDKLIAYFKIKREAEAVYAEVEYAETYISKHVYDAIRVCQVKGGLAVACGDAGIGKTKAARKSHHDNPGKSVYISVNPCVTSVKSVLKMIAAQIGATIERSQYELWYSIAGKLSDGMVIIIDEAQHLTLKSIEVLRSFADYFAGMGQTLGIIFIGNSETINRMGYKKAEFAQIANRTKMVITHTARDIRKDDLMLLFPLLAGKEMEIEFMLQIAQSPQALRGAINLFGNAYDNGNYTYNGLVSMAKAMKLAV